MRNLHPPFEEADLVECLDVRRESTVDAEDFSLNNGANAQIVEHLGAIFLRVGVSVLADGLVVEAVHRRDLSCLVVAAEKSDMSRILQLEAEQQLEGLDGVVAAINEVSHENVSGVWNLTSFLEEFEQVVELAVDVTADRDWSAHWLHVALFYKNLLDLLAEDAEVAFWQDSTVFDGSEPRVDVGFC